MRYAHGPFVKPGHDVLQSLHAMPRLSRSMQAVALARENNHHRRPVSILQRAKHLLASGVGRRDVIIFSFNEHDRGMDFLHIGNRRTGSVRTPVLKWWNLEPYGLEPREIRRIPPGFPI